MAASGFVRFRDHVTAQTADVQNPGERLRALSRSYIGFAQAYPGLFQLMFRSERLDWNRESLAIAGAAAFGLLTLPDDESADVVPPQEFEQLVAATTRWSFAHGIAMLLIDGRLEAIATKVPGTDVGVLIEEMLKGLVRKY